MKYSEELSIQIEDRTLDTPGFTCLPAYGGRLQSLTLRDGKTTASVLKSFQNEDEIESDISYQNTVLFPFVNRLGKGKYHFRNQEYQFPVNEPATGNALHGFLMNEELEIASIKQSKDDQLDEICLYFENADKYDFYPFNVRFKVCYKLLRENLFRVELEALNLGIDDAPVALGWHPYFVFNHIIDDIKLKMPLSDQIEVDQNLLPTGKRKAFADFTNNDQPAKLKNIGQRTFDNCFQLHDSGPKKISLISEIAGFQLDITQSQNLSYTQLFTPSDRKSIAVEPVSANINAFQTGEGLTILQPGKAFSAWATVELRELEK